MLLSVRMHARAEENRQCKITGKLFAGLNPSPIFARYRHVQWKTEYITSCPKNIVFVVVVVVV